MPEIVQPRKQPDWRTILQARHIALPPEHGAWVFLLSPLIIGLVIGGFRPASALLVLTALAAFLVRQPIVILVKVHSGRRKSRELPAALFWLIIYSLVGLFSGLFLLVLGYRFLLWLIIPALPVFAWHLWLVRRRAERRQMFVEVLASGVLALAAPAAFWVGRAAYQPQGWLLWFLVWLQVAGTILYAYLRLEQRALKAQPTLSDSFQMGRTAFVFNLALFLLVSIATLIGWLPPWLPLAYLVQPIEVLWGITRPAVGVRPQRIGIRQLIVSIVFTVLFLAAW